MIQGKRLTTLLLVAGIAGVASAQTPNWTGFYLGVNAGYGFGKSDVTTATVFSSTGYFAQSSVNSINQQGVGSVSPKGFVGGLTLGYNAQSGQAVYGAEFDYGAFSLKGDRSVVVIYPGFAPTGYALNQTTKADSLGTLRGRIGYADGAGLWYFTAGFAFTSVKIEDTFADTFATAAEAVSKSKSRSGWTAGVGYEYALPDQWSLKAEVLYVDFGKSTVDGGVLTAFTPAIAFPANTFTHTATLKGEVVRLGLNYKF